MWLTMIVLHTITALAAFVIGVAVMDPARARRQPALVSALVWLVAAMVVFVVGAMAAHWDDIGTGARVTFSALVALGGYMVLRSARARSLTPRSTHSAAYLDHVGFVLISLFDGFAIVAAIDLGAPTAVVVLVGVLGVVVGVRGIDRAKRRTGVHDGA